MARTFSKTSYYVNLLYIQFFILLQKVPFIVKVICRDHILQSCLSNHKYSLMFYKLDSLPAMTCNLYTMEMRLIQVRRLTYILYLLYVVLTICLHLLYVYIYYMFVLYFVLTIRLLEILFIYTKTIFIYNMNRTYYILHLHYICYAINRYNTTNKKQIQQLTNNASFFAEHFMPFQFVVCFAHYPIQFYIVFLAYVHLKVFGQCKLFNIFLIYNIKLWKNAAFIKLSNSFEMYCIGCVSNRVYFYMSAVLLYLFFFSVINGY